MEPQIISYIASALVALISYMWVRLQRQIDRQQTVINDHTAVIGKLNEQKNGDFKLLNQKIDQQAQQITEIKTDLKDLTRSIHELKGSVQSGNHEKHN